MASTYGEALVGQRPGQGVLVVVRSVHRQAVQHVRHRELVAEPAKLLESLLMKRRSAFELSRDEDDSAESAKGPGVDLGRELSGGVDQLLVPANAFVGLLRDPERLERERYLQRQSDVTTLGGPVDRGAQVVQLGGRDLEALPEVDRVGGQMRRL